MNVLFKALKDEYLGDAALVAATEGLFNTSAPQGQDMPYLVMLLVGIGPDWTFNTAMEDAIIQFAIYSNESSPEEAGNIFELLKACYDDKELSIAGYVNRICQRQPGAFLTRTPDDAWQYVVTYRIMAQET